MNFITGLGAAYVGLVAAVSIPRLWYVYTTPHPCIFIDDESDLEHPQIYAFSSTSTPLHIMEMHHECLDKVYPNVVTHQKTLTNQMEPIVDFTVRKEELEEIHGFTYNNFGIKCEKHAVTTTFKWMTPNGKLHSGKVRWFPTTSDPYSGYDYGHQWIATRHVELC